MATLIHESSSSSDNQLMTNVRREEDDDNLGTLSDDDEDEEEDDDDEEEDDDDDDDSGEDSQHDQDNMTKRKRNIDFMINDGADLRHRTQCEEKTETKAAHLSGNARAKSSASSSSSSSAFSLFTTFTYLFLAFLRSPLRLLNSLPPRWRNWCVRGISGWTLIFGFGFVIYMGPVALMVLCICLAIGCYHELTTISYNVHRTANVPLIRSLSWYYLFVVLHLFYGDSLVRHFNDYLSAANIDDDGAIGGGAIVGDPDRSSALNRISEVLEAVLRFHPTTSFFLYACGITVGFLPLVVKRRRRGSGGRRRSKSGMGSVGGFDGKGDDNVEVANQIDSPSAISFEETLRASSSHEAASLDASGPPSTAPSPTPSAAFLLKKQFVIFTWSHMALFFFLFPSHFAVLNMAVGGYLWFLIPSSIVIFNDISAYIFGFFFGKTPLIALSPKKTWEGFLGSAFSTLLFGALFSGWYLDSILAQNLTLKDLESLTLKSGAAELRRRGVRGINGVIGVNVIPLAPNLSPEVANLGAAAAAAAETTTAASPKDESDASNASPSQREIILRLDHFVCRVNVSGGTIVGGGGGGGGGGGVGKRLSWEKIAASIVCDRAAVFKLANYSLPETITWMWGTIGSKVVRQVEIYPFQLHAFVFSIFAALIAPFGGFFASGFKRAFKIKDFGAIIPGHGGLTDRFDCQLFMSFFVFVYHSSFIEGHYEGSSLASLREGVVGGGAGGGGAGGFGRPRGSGVGWDPIGSSPMEIVKSVLQLEAKDQLWLFERMKETLGSG